MALPATFANNGAAEGSWRVGPFQASTGDVYILTLDTQLSTDNRVNLEGSTDPSTTNLTSKATWVPGTVTIAAMAAVQVGDTLHVAVQDALGEVYHNTANISTSGSESFGSGSTVATVSNQVNENVAIGVRSDGDIVVAYSGERFFDMGKSYATVTARVSTDGSTWGSDIAISSGSTARSQMLASAAMGASDRFHVFFHDNVGATTADLRYVELNSSDTASTPATIDGDIDGSATAENTHIPSTGGAIAWNDGTAKMGVAYHANSTDDVAFAYSDDDGTPSWTITNNATDDHAHIEPAAAGHASNRQIHTLWDSVNSDLYIVYVDNTGQDLLYNKSTDSGATWGTDASLQTGTLRETTAAFFSRSGTGILAVAYDDNGTDEYDEVDLGGGGISQAITGKTESNTAGTLTVILGPLSKALAAATESSTAATLTPSLGPVSVALTAATETSTAATLTPTSALSVALTAATETDTAATLSPSLGALSVALSAATESDVAGTVTPSLALSQALTAASESDTAATLTPSVGPVSVALTAATESATAATLTPSLGPVSVALTAATGTDTAGTLTATLALSVALTAATETSTAATLTPTLVLSQALAGATESATAATLTATLELSQAITAATETDTAATLTPSTGGGPQSVAITAATETGTAATLTPTFGALSIAVVAATETSATATLTPSLGALAVALAAATETDTAAALSASLGPVSVALTVSTETGTAATLTVSVGPLSVALTAATESDTAATLTVSIGALAVALTGATETGTAATITVTGQTPTIVGAILVLDALTRALTLDADTRTLSIDADTRTATLDNDDRPISIDADTRSVTLA